MIRRLLPLLLGVAMPLVAQQREVRALRAAPDVAIRLWVPAGMVEVEGWDHDSVEVRATPTRGTRFGGGGTAAAMKFSLEAMRATDTLLPSAQMRVFVPRGAKVWIKSTVAGVGVRGLRGQLDILQVGGSTTGTDLRGTITVESIDGTTDLTRVHGVLRVRGGAGLLRLSDVGGTIDASLVSARVMMTRDGSSSGAAQAAGASLSGRIETVSGPVTFIGQLGERGHLEVVTHDGSIRLMLAGERAPQVTVMGGSVDLDPELATGDPRVGRFVLRTFKGAVNATRFGGI